MKHFFFQGALGGDVEPVETTVVISAPNEFTAIHVIAKLLFDHAHSGEAENKALRRLWDTPTQPITLYGNNSVTLTQFVNVPDSDLDTMKKYFPHHTYDFNVMAEYGNYQRMFEPSVILNESLSSNQIVKILQ